MLKLITKVAIFLAVILMVGIVFGNSVVGMGILLGVLFLIVALLVMILTVLIKEFQLLKSFRVGGLRGGKGHEPYLKIRYKNIDVSYLWSLNGGGVIMAYEFVRVVAEKMGKVEHVFEYCAGPGFIGFGLLANDLCNRLTLADVNPAALAAIRDTIKNNNLQDKVTVYVADGLAAIPRTEQWDLVVGNPPWYICPKEHKSNIRLCDPEGRVHKDFYHNIAKYLKPDGTILFIEGGEFTDMGSFVEMMRAGDIELIDTLGTVSFRQIFKGVQDYAGLSAAGGIFLRFGLFVRETYFVWSRRRRA